MNVIPNSIHRKQFVYLIYIFSVLILLAACEPISSDDPVAVPSATVGADSNETRIQIIVSDDQTQQPIKQAEVSLTLPQQIYPLKYTDNTGRVIFEVNRDLINEITTVNIQKDEYETETRQIVLATTPILTIFLVPIGATAVPRETPTITPIPATPLPNDTNTPMPTETSTAVPTITPTATQISVATSSEIPSTPQTTTTAVLSASIFAQPNVNSEQLTFIDIGETVLVLDEQGSWMRVRNDDGIEGWASKSRFQPPSDGIVAVVNLSVTIFSGPGENYPQITFLNPGTEVIVLGRSANASWLNIFTADLIEGWVAVSHMTLDRDINEISVVDESIIISLNEVSGDLTLDFWDLAGSHQCTSSGWKVSLFMEGHGGSGSYTYFVNGIRVAGPTSGSVTYDFSAGGNASLIISGNITSGDGYSITKEIFISPQGCN